MPEAPHLDERLLAAGKLVKQGLPAADIGCDHAKLSAWLVCTGRCPRVIACDLRKGPLEKAALTCRQYKCEDRVELRLANGLELVEPGEAASIVLAGISAQTSIEILEAAPWVKTPGLRLICVPATKAGLLRRWLWQNGFSILQDEPVKAAGRWYSAFCGEYSGELYEASDLECAVGSSDIQNTNKEYLAQLTDKIKKLRLGAEKDAALAKRLDDLLRALTR